MKSVGRNEEFGQDGEVDENDEDEDEDEEEESGKGEKRKRETDDEGEDDYKTPVTCKKKNCSVLVGLLTWIW